MAENLCGTKEGFTIEAGKSACLSMSVDYKLTQEPFRDMAEAARTAWRPVVWYGYGQAGVVQENGCSNIGHGSTAFCNKIDGPVESVVEANVSGDSFRPVHAGTARLDWATTRAYYDADQAFHLILLKNCGNRYLLGFFQSLSPHVHRFRQILTSGRDDIEYATKEHDRVLAALEAGDPEEASRAMRDHMDSVRRRAVADDASSARRPT